MRDILISKNKEKCVDLRREESMPVLFSHGRKIRTFFTEDSKLYVTPREHELLRRGMKLDRRIHKWDNVSSRIVANFVSHKPEKQSALLDIFEKRYAELGDSMAETSQNFISQFSLVRLWNLSIIGSILFGMIMMTFVYKYLGQGAAADQIPSYNQPSSQGRVLGAQAGMSEDEEFAKEVLEIEKANEKSLENEIRKMVKGYPIESMVPYIAQKDRTVAAFLVGIAKKESAWGKRRPVLNGQDCYNYWGYRGKRRLMGTGGHTCFNSPKDAVDTVAKRIETLVEKYDNKTPTEMVEPWKCGYDCAATGGHEAARKWISDVSLYFDELNEEGEDY